MIKLSPLMIFIGAIIAVIGYKLYILIQPLLNSGMSLSQILLSALMLMVIVIPHAYR